MKTQIEGLTYLLAQDENGTEWVQAYSAGDMAEIFSATELAELAAGQPIVQPQRIGAIRFVDMVAAARTVRAEA